MRLERDLLISFLEEEIKNHKDILPERIIYLLQELIVFIEQTEEVKLFEILIILIIKTEYTPAKGISNLLSVIKPNELFLLEYAEFSEIACFLKDYITKDSYLSEIKRFP